MKASVADVGGTISVSYCRVPDEAAIFCPRAKGHPIDPCRGHVDFLQSLFDKMVEFNVSREATSVLSAGKAM